MTSSDTLSFAKVEAELFVKLTLAGVSSASTTALEKLPGTVLGYLFGSVGLQGYNPLVHHARDTDLAWILDNTAYEQDSVWKAETVSCFFQRGRGDITKAVAAIADTIGLDGKAGIDCKDPEVQKRIKDRLKPFIYAVAPLRTLPVVVSIHGDSPFRQRLLGPSGSSGIACQGYQVMPQKGLPAVETTVDPAYPQCPAATGTTRLYTQSGFGLISDIDDTIKITQTPNPIGILRTTFAEEPHTTKGMQSLYTSIQSILSSPPTFYVSASPYNLYSFLHTFISDNYPLGQIFLRDASWQTLGGLLSTLTQNVKEYKCQRLDTIHSWFPKRKMVCFGDSTQEDPETYATMYKKYPGWIVGIYIRRVTDAPNMDTKNRKERFEKAFEGVPKEVWFIFEGEEGPVGVEEHLKGRVQATG